MKRHIHILYYVFHNFLVFQAGMPHLVDRGKVNMFQYRHFFKSRSHHDNSRNPCDIWSLTSSETSRHRLSRIHQTHPGRFLYQLPTGTRLPGKMRWCCSLCRYHRMRRSYGFLSRKALTSVAMRVCCMMSCFPILSPHANSRETDCHASNGTLGYEGACCRADCDICKTGKNTGPDGKGPPECRDRPGGRDNCCPWKIHYDHIKCSMDNYAPCVLPDYF